MAKLFVNINSSFFFDEIVMANAVIKHFRGYKYLISNDIITLAKTKVEITSAFSGSLRISINKNKWLWLERLKCARKW